MHNPLLNVIISLEFMNKITIQGSQWSFVSTSSPEIKDISSPLTIISGIPYYTPEQ